jgi:excisionase family DNA binding protein
MGKSPLTVTEAADELGYDRSTILRRIYANQLSAFRIGREWRIRREDWQSFIAKYVERSTVESQGAGGSGRKLADKHLKGAYR